MIAASWTIVAAGSLIAGLLGVTFGAARARRVTTVPSASELLAARQLPTSANLDPRTARTLSDLLHQHSLLDARLQELDSVFRALHEGVLLVDDEERIVLGNDAAAKLIDSPLDEIEGRSLREAIRHPDLHAMMNEALRSGESREGEVILLGSGERVLGAYIHPLRRSSTRPPHAELQHDVRWRALIVLQDTTRLHRLETIRRDFVANVSHELRTPITSIKGFIETLADGAVHEPEAAKKFLGILAKQAHRLHQILEDLLMLSRLEEDGGTHAEAFSLINLASVILSAIEICESRANEKQIRIVFAPQGDITLLGNSSLLEQAVVNLIDNAIKYSEAEREVVISLSQNAKETCIAVRDQGIGIEAHHLSRIFERFYRVDRARSRRAGGTGLGLAIVKHIAHVHGGHATVASTPGEGSTFTIHLSPAPLGALLESQGASSLERHEPAERGGEVEHETMKHAVGQHPVSESRTVDPTQTELFVVEPERYAQGE